jgi:NIPSNAP
MIYLEESYNLEPASPETVDAFVEFARKQFVPACERLGARLVAAWYSDVDWFAQVTHALEFDDLAALGAFREQAVGDSGWTACQSRLEELAPERSSKLLEALGPIPPETLRRASEESRETPLGVYSQAVLEVAPGKMPQFIAALEASTGAFPIVASWRTISGNPNEVTDIWKGALRQSGYEPADEAMKQFFTSLREMAPREHLRPIFPLPYSPLR